MDRRFVSTSVTVEQLGKLTEMVRTKFRDVQRHRELPMQDITECTELAHRADTVILWSPRDTPVQMRVLKKRESSHPRTELPPDLGTVPAAGTTESVPLYHGPERPGPTGDTSS